jgi:hypothetical protein
VHYSYFYNTWRKITRWCGCNATVFYFLFERPSAQVKADFHDWDFFPRSLKSQVLIGHNFGHDFLVLWNTNLIKILYKGIRPLPLVYSQTSWLQLQRSGFDSRRYQVFWEVVGLERDPLGLVSTFEELLQRRSSSSGLENLEYGSGNPSRRPRCKGWH